MATYPVRTRRWTRVEYDRLIDIGVFLPNEPLELLGGELIVSEPQGSAHGEFKRSSQHLTRGGCDDDTEAVFGAGRTSQTTLARPPLGAAA